MTENGPFIISGSWDNTLKVWDLAGNRSSASRQVVMQRNAPQVDAKVVNRGGDTALTITQVSAAPFPLRAWQATLKSATGAVLLQADGQGLPQTLPFTPPAGETRVFFSFEGVDELGNRREVIRKELLVKIEEQAVETQEAESWVPDF